jgi:hypothetical protein
MSLQRLRLSLERLIPPGNADTTRLADFESLFLTSRQCSEKYQRLIPEMLNAGNSEEPADFEQTMMWFAFKNDKPPDESIFGDNEEEKEERWKKDWLDRMERREWAYLTQPPRVVLTAFEGTDSDHITYVPAVPSHIPPHRSICGGDVRFPQETETARSAVDPLA